MPEVESLEAKDATRMIDSRLSIDSIVSKDRLTKGTITRVPTDSSC